MSYEASIKRRYHVKAAKTIARYTTFSAYSISSCLAFCFSVSDFI
jgi:hypothetical protein